MAMTTPTPSARRTTCFRHRLAMAGALVAVIASAGLSQVSAGTVPLAGITWGTATTIAGDSDADTTGSLVYAYNFGESGSVAGETVNGVTFQPFGINTSSYSGTATHGNVTVTEVVSGVLASDVNTGSVIAPFSGLGVNYQSLLSSEVYSNNFASLKIDLGGLTIGQQYRLQWWTNDSSRTFYAGSYYFEDVIGAGSSGSVTLDSNTTNTVGGVGQFVIGTFTASNTTESFTLTGSGTGIWTFPMVNALQLRVNSSPVPEIDPAGMGSVFALVTGALGLLERRRLKVA